MSRPEFSEAEHEVTLREERPVAEKEAVPVERVRLAKECVADEETVAGKSARSTSRPKATPVPAVTRPARNLAWLARAGCAAAGSRRMGRRQRLAARGPGTSPGRSCYAGLSCAGSCGGLAGRRGRRQAWRIGVRADCAALDLRPGG